tara:strand:+ start:62 stop:484 length:423 start_codon:yes stop_codon:yes gene_type:complete
MLLLQGGSANDRSRRTVFYIFYDTGFADMMEKFRPYKTVDRLKKLFISLFSIISVLSPFIYIYWFMITKTELGVENYVPPFFLIFIIIFFILSELSYAVFLFLPKRYWHINWGYRITFHQIFGMIYMSALITFLIKFLLL